MAKSRDKGLPAVELSPAFQHRANQELGTLKEAVARSLQEDIIRMLEEEIHSDLLITNGKDVVWANKCIVQTRTKHLWQDSWLIKKPDDFGKIRDCIEMPGLTRQQLENFVRQLYSVSEGALLMEEFVSHIFTHKQMLDVTSDRRDSGDKAEESKNCAEKDKVMTTKLSSDENEEKSVKEGCVHQVIVGEDKEKTLTATKEQIDGKNLQAEEIKGVDNGTQSGPSSRMESQISDPSAEDSAGLEAERENQSETEAPGSHSAMHVPRDKTSGSKTDPEDYDSVSSHTDTRESCPNSSRQASEYSSLSVPYETCSPLGRDLLQMHLQELHCDCALNVDGIHFMAHRCVLAARCEYFQAMFGGQWSESTMRTVTLEGVAPKAVEQLLLFLYGGVIELATPSDIAQLFVVADMYGVLTLKTVLVFYVKKDLCHFFHKPCQTCLVGVCDALALCCKFHLEDLQSQCLKSMSKYFTKIWPTKAFSTLPDALQQMSVNAVMSQMSPKNVLDIIQECDKLTTSLPRIRWTENVLFTISQLMDAAIEFTSKRFLEVIQTSEFMEWTKSATWKAGVLEEIFNSVIDSLPVETACFVFQDLAKLKTYFSSPENFNSDALSVLDPMLQRCEKYFRTHLHQVMRAPQWALVPKEIQDRILESSSYVRFDSFSEPARAKPPPVKTSSKLVYASVSERRPASTAGQVPTGAVAAQVRVTKHAKQQQMSEETGPDRKTLAPSGTQGHAGRVPASRSSKLPEKERVKKSGQQTSSRQEPSQSHAKNTSETGKCETNSAQPTNLKKERDALSCRSSGAKLASSTSAGKTSQPSSASSSKDDETNAAPQKEATTTQLRNPESERPQFRYKNQGTRCKSSPPLKARLDMSASGSDSVPIPQTKKSTPATNTGERLSRTPTQNELLAPRKVGATESGGVKVKEYSISPTKQMLSKLPIRSPGSAGSRSRPASQVFDSELESGSGSLGSIGMEPSQSEASNTQSSAPEAEHKKIIHDSSAPTDSDKPLYGSEDLGNASCRTDTNISECSASMKPEDQQIDCTLFNERLSSENSGLTNLNLLETETSPSPSAIGALAIPNAGESRGVKIPIAVSDMGESRRIGRQEHKVNSEVKVVPMSKSLTVGFVVPPE